jgi:hypothetical protein
MCAMTETILERDPNIVKAIMFGRSKFQAGVLIMPAIAFDPQDITQLAEYRNKIWCVLICSTRVSLIRS